MWGVGCVELGSRLRRFACGLWVAIAVAALAGCSSDFSRADFASLNPSYGSQGSDQIVTASLPPVPSEPVYGRSSGSRYGASSNSGYNSDYDYRRSAGVSNAERAVERRNLPQSNIANNSTARVQQAAYTPSSGEVTVKRGDTLYSLSRDHGVPIDRIKSANNMTSTELREGQRIIIPNGALPKKTGITHHRVQRGESLAMIARKYGTTHSVLARANGLDAPDKLQPGDVIEVPQGGVAMASAKQNRSAIAVPRIKKVKTERVRVASASPNVPLPRAKPARAPLPKKTANAAKQNPKKVASIGKLPKPQAMSASKFRWPVRGRVISKYGAKANGKHNDGINIAVPQGTSVKAAENGVVAYAGSELKGYGNLILVRHQNNWVSAYAHNSKLMVKRGEKVRRGQIIAKAGQSGSVGQPQLHFELRKGSRPVNPLRHMTGT